MSQNLTDPGTASIPDIAPAAPSEPAADSPASPDAAGAPAVKQPAAAAASDANADIALLDKQYREGNLLAAADDTDDEPETPTLKPEPKAPEKAVEAVADDLAEEVDPLAEERTAPRTPEEVKKQFARSEPSARAEIVRLESETWKLKEAVQKVGGPIGLEIAQSLIPTILKANPGVILGVDGKAEKNPDGSDRTDGDVAFENMVSINGPLVVDMSKRLLSHALNEKAIDAATGEPIYMATGNALIKEHLNPNYDVAQIEKLIAYDEAGLIDHEDLDKELEVYTGPSEREKVLEARLKGLEEKGKGEEAERQSATLAKAQEHHDKAVSYASKQIMDAVIPLAEQFGWTATKEELSSSDPAVKQLAQAKIAMGEMLTDHMEALKRRLPEWTTVDHLGKNQQAFNADGNPTAIFRDNAERLISKAVASFKEKIRILNPTFAKSFGSTRAAQLKAKLPRSGADTREVPPVKKIEPNGHGDEFGKTIAQLDDEYRREQRQHA